ncbi:MAG TPA: Rne/Rng family ribonuclease [Polyangiaceae bacterium]|nr:Rne/Rng family ribonuclease [Polyangiaceae bacterium]
MAGNLLVVNADGPETRVALIQSGQLVEIYIERRRERGIVGNIYKGRVVRVLPGMQASFVDIGAEKAAFLYVADVRGAPEDYKALFLDDDETREERDELPKDEMAKAARGARIEELLKEGQDVLVQVAKAPMGTKGARSTSYVSLPGRNLVFMPTVNHVGISRRIGSEKERKRLRAIIESMRPEGAGFIVRTVAEGVSERDLRADMEFLIKLWNTILKRNETSKAPSLLYNDLDLLLRTVRDMLTADVERMIVDSRPEFDRVLKFVQTFMPDFASKIELYAGREPIFDGYGIEAEIDRALERKVWLKSGGYLIVDQGEALTAIDVNTGKFVGKKNLEETITKNNVEACKEIADQLRLRNTGGIIVIDFVDMDKPQNREKVSRAFNEALKDDRAKANVTAISELGLVEMTRKRTRESLLRTLTEPCFYCEGKGYLKSKTTICYQVLRELRRDGSTFAEDAIEVRCHPEIADQLATSDQQYVDELEKRLQKKIIIKARDCHLEEYEIVGKEPREERRERKRGNVAPQGWERDREEPGEGARAGRGGAAEPDATAVAEED